MLGSSCSAPLRAPASATRPSAAVVAFEVDYYADTAAPEGWIVLIRGVAQQITHPAELAAANKLPLESWDGDVRADRIVKIEPVLTTGRRITAAIP